jgi:hypothetical protein
VAAKSTGDPCIDLLAVFEQQVKNVGGDELWAEYQTASRADKIKMTDVIMEELDLQKRQAVLRGLAWDRMQKHFKSSKVDAAKAFNDLISGGGIRQAGTISLENRIDAIQAIAHSKLYKMMEKYRPRKLGLANSKDGQRNLIREVFHPGSTGDKDAAQYAKMWKEVTEELRLRFNKAGGGIQKLFDWNLPQYHDPVKINRVSAEEWFNDVSQWIDRDRVAAYQVADGEVRAARTISDKQFRYLMIGKDGEGGIFAHLRTDGVITHKKAESFNPLVRRAVGNRHQQHRLLSFKDSEAWMAYADKYGATDYFNSMMGHIELISREIGAMEMFGPNPDTMIKQLRMLVQQETAKAGGKNARGAGWLAENAYEIAMGRMFSNYTSLSDAMRVMRNTVTGLKIGAASISAISDLAFLAKTSHFVDIPIFKTYMRFLRNITHSKESRQIAARLGLLAEYARDRAVAAHRISEVTGVGASARFADVVVRGSGLNFWTNSAKQAFGMEFLAAMADRVSSPWKSLSPKMKRAFERYGINEKDWARIASSELFEHEGVRFINPAAFEDVDLSAKVIGMIREETHFAVPEPNAKARALLTGGQPSGTPLGEVARLMGQFKSFPISVALTHFARALNETGMSRYTYLASLLGGTTVLGAMAIQAKQVAAGKTPKDMDPAFWLSAIAQGGGAGILGDFLFMDHSRFGSVSEYLMGPTVGEGEIILRAFLGTGNQALKGKDRIGEKFGRGAARVAQDFIPSVWYTKLATQRFLGDWIGQMLDPSWRRKQRTLQRSMQREYGQSFWWRPGRKAPHKSPFAE